MKTYRTRYSVFLVVLLLGMGLVILIPLIEAFRSGRASEIYTSLGILVLYYAICAGALTTTYTIDADSRLLIITNMFGLAKSRKDIMKMTRISDTRTWLSAPASSLKRICIDYKESRFHSDIVISPYMQEDFIADLRKINPEIVDETRKVNG